MGKLPLLSGINNKKISNKNDSVVKKWSVVRMLAKHTKVQQQAVCKCISYCHGFGPFLFYHLIRGHSLKNFLDLGQTGRFT